MGKVHRTKGVLAPKSDQLKSEPEIVGGMAQAFFKDNHPVEWQSLGSDYNAIRDKIAATISGFEAVTEKSKGSGFFTYLIMCGI